MKKSAPQAVALFSGGLDSTLAVCVIKAQGIRIEALHVRTMFESGTSGVEELIARLGIGLTSRELGDDYIELLKNPRWGYGSAVNPCIDCRVYMMRMAKRLMEELGAEMVISGEVLGQRPMSQKRADFDLVEKASELNGRLLRPLSARLLPPTLAEREGLVDRERLYGFSGRGRSGLLELAEQFGIEQAPSPSSGCRLTEKSFAPRLRDLMLFVPRAGRWEYEILNVGRHIRVDAERKIVVGRNKDENAAIRAFAARGDRPQLVLIEPHGFLGPDALLLGRIDEPGVLLAGGLVVGYSRRANQSSEPPLVRVSDQRGVRIVPIRRGLSGADFTIL